MIARASRVAVNVLLRRLKEEAVSIGEIAQIPPTDAECVATFSDLIHSKATSAEREVSLFRARSRMKERLLAKYGDTCTDCKVWHHPAVLEFDRVYSTGEFSVAQGISRGLSWERLCAEAEKCEVRCANCIRMKEYRKRADIERFFRS